MPQVNGLFDSFDNVDQIDIGAVITWLKTPVTPVHLENYLANRILYPQTVPVTDYDMKIDLAILREALRMNTQSSGTDSPFLNLTTRKLIIPERFLKFVPNLVNLTWAFIDGLLSNRRKEDQFSDLWTVVVSDDADEIVGSILLPEFANSNDKMELKLFDKKYEIKMGSLTVIPCPKDRCEIAYKFATGKILGQKEAALEIYGGKLGLMIDGRASV